MATRLPGWLKFAGWVCGIGVLLSIGLLAGSFFLLRSSVRQFEAADQSFDAVAERFGGIAEYRPAPDGTIPAERLEAFLAAREKVGRRRYRMEGALMLLSGDRSVLARTRGTVGLVRNLAPFHRERNEALLEAGVGLGEYYYLYTLVYYAWLGKSPTDGPPFEIVGDEGYLLQTIESREAAAVLKDREEQARRSINRLMLPVLENQLADLASPGGAFETALASEIAALAADGRRLPWEDGLPAIVEQSLLPYRERLDDSYSPMCNAVEIGLARREPRPATGEALASS